MSRDHATIYYDSLIISVVQTSVYILSSSWQARRLQFRNFMDSYVLGCCCDQLDRSIIVFGREHYTPNPTLITSWTEFLIQQ